MTTFKKGRRLRRFINKYRDQSLIQIIESTWELSEYSIGRSRGHLLYADGVTPPSLDDGYGRGMRDGYLEMEERMTKKKGRSQCLNDY